MNIDVSMGDAVTIQEGGSGTRSAQPRVLAEVDHFEIQKPLGAGGFGTVYLARDTTSDIDVALKVVGKDRKTAFCSFGWDDAATPRGAEGSKGLENELRENFRLIHGLTHPNIAVSYPLHLVRDVKRLGDGVSISRGDILSVMAYAPGVTLDKWRMMFEGGRVPVRLAGDIVMQIASALDYAHTNGVIHRDVKPSNVMVDTREGCKPFVRLLDFGLAATADGGRGMCGTPQYMSPEQWGGGRQDARTDQYSLAVLACELLTGHVPLENVFSCDDREIMRIAVMNRKPEYPKGLSGKRRQVVEKAMAKSPDKRFASCAEFAVALFPRPRPWLLALGCFLVVFVLLVIGVGSFLLLKDRSARTAQSPTVAELAGQEPMVEPKTDSVPLTPPRPQPNPIQEVKKVVVQIPVPEPLPRPKPSAEDLVKSLLKDARGFADKKRWRECLDTVNVILELDPNHRQAQQLKARAENGLSTQDSPRVATPQNTLHGSRDANGLELLNQRDADDDWRHKKSKFFD